MTREFNYEKYVAENRTRFRRTLFRTGKPQRRGRPRSPGKAFVLFLLAAERRKKWLRQGKLKQTGPRQYTLR
ncbi:MAG: hypothetical protein AB1507_05860 [Bacillota bacterium]|jgi:hypothetical protein